MMRILFIALVVAVGCRLLLGKWPWEYLQTRSRGGKEIDRARRLLGVSPKASEREIREAHRRMAAILHPDRGGSTAKLAEVNAARDLLLALLPQNTIDQEPPEPPQ
ncbi:molecular chaperone DnaJ [Erythrobacter sp. QSSC1-22B]|uniref:J domain-containing protein n=1 Tax=Erythrobacter sp. QSSC1-22B TaxID=1860125 RepID=UPI000805AE4C|nr:J domain-containing protein [Erythrobacter sp. QSSC1-22B]OBX19883.1 molecular chaperone DnaJ [Erythrobacter sp. QSSC1-22B]